jgi:hypothetical protein
MSLIDLDNVKLESDIKKDEKETKIIETPKKTIDITKYNSLKKEAKKKHGDLLHLLNKIYKLQASKNIGDAIITIENVNLN